MPPDLAAEYLRKGQEDEAMLAEVVDNRAIADSIFGFHVQQAIEKYVKAVLAHLRARVPKSHDLAYLLQEVESAGAFDLPDIDRVDGFTPFGVEDRYPFALIAFPEARSDALAFVRSVRAWTESILSD